MPHSSYLFPTFKSIPSSYSKVVTCIPLCDIALRVNIKYPAKLEGVLLEAGRQLSCFSWGDLCYYLWCPTMVPIFQIEHEHQTYLCYLHNLPEFL